MRFHHLLAPSLFLLLAAALRPALAQQPLSSTPASVGQCVFQSLEDGMIGGLDFKPFALPAHGEQKYIGVIVETPQGPYFAMGHYDWTEHRGLIAEIERRTGGSGQLLWAGELRIENRASTPGFGRITAINETSSELVRRTTEEQRAGAAAKALQLLKRAYPQMVDPDARAIAFDRSAMHLDPELSLLKADIRHGLGNSLAEFDGPLTFYLEDRSEIVPFEDMQAAWAHVSSALTYLEKKGYLRINPDERSLVHDVDQARSWRDLTRLGDPTLKRLNQFLDQVNALRTQMTRRYEEPMIVHRIPTAQSSNN